MKTILFAFIFFLVATGGSAQEAHWTIVNGQARMQTVIAVPDKDADCLYKQVSRWLVATFKNSEDVLKARIESEYLRGEAYHSSLCQLGALSSVDFRYTFSLDIKDEKVRLTFSKGVLLYDNTEDKTGVHPIEAYFEHPGKKRIRHSEFLLASVDSFSGSLLTSLQGYLLDSSDDEDNW